MEMMDPETELHLQGEAEWFYWMCTTVTKEEQNGAKREACRGKLCSVVACSKWILHIRFWRSAVMYF